MMTSAGRPSRSSLPSQVVVLLSLLLAAPAHADALEATLGQPLREVSHAVTVQLNQGLATYLVQRSFANAGARHEEAFLQIGLPCGAAATGLRIRSGKRWYSGELMERERAAALYRQQVPILYGTGRLLDG